MAKKNAGGRPSIFAPKTGRRLQGTLTKHGTKLFEQARKDLAKREVWKASAVSDADAVEFLARVFAGEIARTFVEPVRVGDVITINTPHKVNPEL